MKQKVKENWNEIDTDAATAADTTASAATSRDTMLQTVVTKWHYDANSSNEIAAEEAAAPAAASGSVSFSVWLICFRFDVSIDYFRASVTK